MVKDVLNNVDVFENSIEEYLNEFCNNNNIEDMKAEPQSVWNAALMFIQKNVFKNRDFLKTSKPHPNYINNEYTNQYSNLNKSTCNAYDLDKIECMCDIYIYLCLLNDKVPCKFGFCIFTGIKVDTLLSWERNIESSLSKSRMDILQKIYTSEEEALTSKAFSLRNPTGALAALNHKKGWREDGKLHIQQVEQKTADQLPRLDTAPQYIAAVEDKNH